MAVHVHATHLHILLPAITCSSLGFLLFYCVAGLWCQQGVHAHRHRLWRQRLDRGIAGAAASALAVSINMHECSLQLPAYGCCMRGLLKQPRQAGRQQS